MDCQGHNAPEQVSALMVDLLFGTTGHTNELRLPTTYCLKEGAAETLRALLLRATACLCLVSNLPDLWGNLGRALEQDLGTAVRPFLLPAHVHREFWHLSLSL
jgi:hypothetical protein